MAEKNRCSFFLALVLISCCEGLIRAERAEEELKEKVPGLDVQRNIYNLTNYINDTLSSIQMEIRRKMTLTLDQLELAGVFPDHIRPKTCEKGMVLNSTYYPFSYAIIYPNQSMPMNITFPHLCDHVTDGGGWIVIQRRSTGEVNFTRGWNDYKHGFGSFRTNFWLGNEKIHQITTSGKYEIKITIKYNNTLYTADYRRFIVQNESWKYRLLVFGYRGTGTTGNAMYFHHQRYFSTFDSDNDSNYYLNCARENTGGWWFFSCYGSNLNGEWGAYGPKAARWNTLSLFGELQYTEMKIRKWGSLTITNSRNGRDQVNTT
ncbi:hypothetical protein EGW08_008699 [Elysia chlorotica]|uniref:Fibrinogen C-terminal domain-containing protein n=1 Tax=Elysia chlorotica TaxID=188477 RepID=A0A433TPR5_ELYCH|nr:hypothetical protein EGW08_008699 [Elysia chlorotica]